MFKDEDQETVTISSDSSSEKYVRDQLCQTNEIQEEEKSSQCRVSQDAETQTEFIDALPNTKKIQIDNSKALCNFLLKVYPDVTEQLIANSRSHAFDDYEVKWEEQTDAIECSFTLKHEDATLENEQITCLSWNSAGSTIAASYGHNDHTDWCVHKSCISMWNIDRRNLDSKKADKTIDVSSCVTSIHFHPVVPALLAGGDFSGLVYIWDLSREEDPLVANSGKIEDSHQEPVSKVTWMKEESGARFKHKLMSISTDGKALLWEYNQLKKELQLMNGFILQSSCLPRTNMSIRGDAELGVSCLTFSRHDDSMFLLGSENGGVFKCSLSARGALIKGLSSGVEFRSPVTFAFTPHTAAVFAIDMSPFHHNLFVTSSMDTTIRIYSLLQPAPLLTVEAGCGYLLDAHWSPTRASLITTSTADGRLMFFDLSESSVAPAKILDVDPEKHEISSCRYNLSRRNLLATGSSDRSIRVWTLSSDLVQERSDDITTMDQMLDENIN